ncbi:MAG: thiamine diphosphokinase [Lachnoclostridium sp.]|jgi:thiamine pyrophosphokinase
MSAEIKSKRILILSGGAISQQFASEYLKQEKFQVIIAVDRGLVTAYKLGISVDYILGDFDSVPKDLLDEYRMKYKSAVTKKYNPQKDATDTHIAINLCLELEADEIVILGATGTRIDHMLANINLLYLPLNKNIKASIVDEHNKIYMINKKTVLYKEKLHGPFISVQPFTEKVTGVTLKGFKYPLVNHTMYIGDSLGVSNELKEEQAEIHLKEGILIIIEAKD